MDSIKNMDKATLIKYSTAVIIIIALSVYFLGSSKESAKNESEEKNQPTISTTTTNTPVKTTTTTKTVPAVAKNVTNKCNFRVTSPAMYSSVSMPFTVKGILDKADKSKGCDWHELDSRAGDAEIFYNRRGEGWKSAGTSVPIITRIVPGGASTTLAFSVSFNLYTQALGLTSGTPIKIVFTELNIPPQPNPDVFDFQVTLK